MIQPIFRLAEYFRALSGKKAYGVAFLLGVAFTAAFPPFWLLPLAVLAFSGWFWMLQGERSRRQRFAIGWWFGFGHHVTGLYWICIALGIDGGAFWWMMPFALCVLPAYLALYTGVLSVLLHWRMFAPVAQVLLFALLWLVLEYIRAHLFYGFPWNLAGYIWTISGATLQPAAWFGVYGLSLWAAAFCVAFSLLAPRAGENAPVMRRGFAAIMAVSLLLVLAGAGRLLLSASAVEDASGVKLRLVQANVEQSLKWDPAFQLEALQTHINLSKRPIAKGFEPDYVIWPETAMPFSLAEGSRWLSLLAEVAPEQGGLLTGVVRREQSENGDWQVWNSLQLVTANADLNASYDKHILVPFGEFVPLRHSFPFLPIDKITHGAIDFSSGTGAANLMLSGSAVSTQPLICYEAIFPEFRVDDTAARPDWLLNITNDAWFGNSTGPYQHLHMARTRAVERGIPLVRAANTGVTAAFDAFGRELGRIPLNTANIVDVVLPPRTIAPTWYSRYGEIPLLFIGYMLLIYVLRQRVKNT